MGTEGVISADPNMLAEVDLSGVPIKVHPLIKRRNPTQELFSNPEVPQVVMFEEFPHSCSKRNQFPVGMIK